MMTSSWLSLKPIMGCVFPRELMICAYYPLIDYSIPNFISAPETSHLTSPPPPSGNCRAANSSDLKQVVNYLRNIVRNYKWDREKQMDTPTFSDDKPFAAVESALERSEEHTSELQSL